MRKIFLAVFIALAASPLFDCQGQRHVGRSEPPASPKIDTTDAGLAAAQPDAGAIDPFDADEKALWAPIDASVKAALDEGKMPGCVVVVGRHDDVIFQRAYGSRSLEPAKTPMTLDTLFDLASLTKPVATATSIVMLSERGLIDLDARASRYVPELSRLPPFTVRQLLVHTSGLPSSSPIADFTPDRAATMKHIGDLTLKVQPGERFIYSDVGFIVLEEIVRRTGGKEFASFATEEIFKPLGMVETGFLPSPELRTRAAPTEQRDGGFIQGEVHDPRAYAMGGVAGHAGLFSTAKDLVRFARAMLAHGALDGHRVFSEKTFARLIARHDTPKGGRALGWDLDSAFASHRSSLFSKKAFGHGGFTGTALWIDPDKDLFVLFLSNRVHPDGKGLVNPLVSQIATLAVNASEVKTGIDVLRAESFERLRGATIGLVTNASAKAKDGTTTIDVLRSAPNVKVKAIFTPEHGLAADREGKIKDAAYGGVPLYSLYGERFSPTASTLDGIDTLVVDLQDVGVRFYTYASTMKRAMQVAAEKKIRVVVLDRPNPIGGLDVQGPVLEIDPEAKPSFVNHHRLPIRHGMTLGELARLFAADGELDLRLDVVKMAGWRRKDWFDATGLSWTSPSPNLPSVRAVVLYPALGLLEGTNVSVGRGTETPFEIVAAPWMNGDALASSLNAAKVEGVAFEPIAVTPKTSVHAGKKCKGIRIRVVDRARFEPIRTGLAIAAAIHAQHPSEWDFDNVDRLLRSKPALDAIRGGAPIATVEATWSAPLASFVERRSAFLLYR